MTTRDFERRLDAIDDKVGATDDVPTMLISPLTDPDDPADRPSWYYHAQSGNIYTPDEVDPDETFACEMEWPIIEPTDWYDPDEFPDDDRDDEVSE